MDEKNGLGGTGSEIVGLIEHIITRDNNSPGDYLQDGIRMCGKCRTAKQQWQLALKTPFEFDGEGKPVRGYRLVSVDCQCKKL